MASVLFRVNMHDGVIFAAVSMLLAVAAIAAGYLPAQARGVD